MPTTTSELWTKVLLIDDDPIQLELLGAYFRKAKFETIVTAGDGRDAVAALNRAKGDFDLVVCDVNMPNLDGIELLNHLSKSQFAGRILIVSGAADVMVELAGKLAERGELKYLGSIKKPVRVESLDYFVFGDGSHWPKTV